MAHDYSKKKIFKAIAAELGCEIVEFSHTGSSHFRMKVRRGSVCVTAHAANSASDWRALANWKSQLRRALAEKEKPLTGR